MVFWFSGRQVVVGLFIIVASYYGSWYVIDPQTRLITHKFFGIPVRAIEIMNVLSVERKSGITGALGLWNIREKYGISHLTAPVRKKEFLEMLTKLNPDISINAGDKKP